MARSLHWRHNDHDGVSNHQPRSCLLNRLFRRRSKKTSKLYVTGLYAGTSPGPVNSPHKGPVTRKTFPFDDVIMIPSYSIHKGINNYSEIVSLITISEWLSMDLEAIQLDIFIIRQADYTITLRISHPEVRRQLPNTDGAVDEVTEV